MSAAGIFRSIRALDFRAESGGGQHGMCFDDWGRKFVCSNSDHLQLVMFEDRYFARNPRFPAPAARRSIAADGPAAEVFRTSPVEPWRTVRTRLRLAGKAPGPIEGGGRAAGYFTGATGVTIYRGSAWPADMRGQALVGDVGGNLVHRKALDAAGLALVGRRIDPDRELLTSTDNWFRPVQFAQAPDGCLYVIDMYREVIEHPRSLPPEIKRHLDLTSGRDRGRLYRLAPDGFKLPAAPQLDRASTTELVATLAHPNGWHRDTAARLLFERRDPAAEAPLADLARDSSSPLGRMHALCALAGLDALGAPRLLAALADPDAKVRAHAVRLAEPLAPIHPALGDKLRQMANDPDPQVRFQLAFTLGALPGAAPAAALARILARDPAEADLQTAVFSSVAGCRGEVLAQLVGDANYCAQPAGPAVLRELADQIGATADAAALDVLENALAAPAAHQPPVARALLVGLLDGRAKLPPSARDRMPPLSPRFVAARAELLEKCRETAVDRQAPIDERTAATCALRIGDEASVVPVLAGLVGLDEPPEIQAAAIATLGRLGGPAVAQALFDAWPRLSPGLRSAALDVLLSRPAWSAALLTALESETLAAAEVDPARIKLLELSAEPDLRERAARLLARAAGGPRSEVLAAYRGALDLPADAERGRAAFRKTCAACHRLENAGFEVGPSLAAIKNRGPEAILLAVLDPNREVNPQYVNYLAVLNDGRTLSGIIAAESATSITLRRTEGASDVVPRAELEALRSTRQSIMPEGLEKQLSHQDLADLIAYLLQID